MRVLGCGAVLLALSAGAAQADGYPPFHGYSPYFGRPATYFTPDTDVHQATTLVGDAEGFSTRTYYQGGPFWGYKRHQSGFGGARHRAPRHGVVLRRKG